MISMDETKSHNWGDSRKATGNHMDAFTATRRTNGEPTRNDPRPCKTLLRVAETHLARLAADGDEASAKALLPYVKREMGR